jgi:hypothetical protein
MLEATRNYEHSLQWGSGRSLSFFSLFSFSSQIKVRLFFYFVAHFKLRSLFNFVYGLKICSLGQKFQANAEGNSDELVDPPKVDDKIGAVLMEFQQIQMWLRGGYDLQFTILDSLIRSLFLCYYVLICDFRVWIKGIGIGIDLQEIASE